jgi:hypothetical protein
MEQKRAEGRLIVGLNFSMHSFSSFYVENTEINRIEYIYEAANAVRSAIPKAFFVLISHDTRVLTAMVV